MIFASLGVIAPVPALDVSAVSFTAESLCPGAAPDNSALLAFDEIESPRATVCGFAVTVAALSLIVAGMVILKSGWLPSPTYLTVTG